MRTALRVEPNHRAVIVQREPRDFDVRRRSVAQADPAEVRFVFSDQTSIRFQKSDGVIFDVEDATCGVHGEQVRTIREHPAVGHDVDHSIAEIPTRAGKVEP